MQQMMRAMGQKDIPALLPTLEINPDHEVVKKLLARSDDPILQDAAWLLLIRPFSWKAYHFRIQLRLFNVSTGFSTFRFRLLSAAACARSCRLCGKRSPPRRRKSRFVNSPDYSPIVQNSRKLSRSLKKYYPVDYYRVTAGYPSFVRNSAEHRKNLATSRSGRGLARYSEG
jgi:hypothetical protein